MGYAIDIFDRATPEVKAKAEELSSARLKAVMARSVVNDLKDNFIKWNASNANKIGGKRTNLGSQFSKATHSDLLPDGFVVSVSHVAARQRLEGGTITARNAKLLTIPAIPEAYDKRAGEIARLRFAVLNGKPALVQDVNGGIKVSKKSSGQGYASIRRQFAFGVGTQTVRVFFWLKRSVKQSGDPTLLPKLSDVAEKALQAAWKVLARGLARRAPGSEGGAA